MVQQRENYIVNFGLGFDQNSYKKATGNLWSLRRVVQLTPTGDETPNELADLARKELIGYYARINEFREEQIRVCVYGLEKNVTV